MGCYSFSISVILTFFPKSLMASSMLIPYFFLYLHSFIGRDILKKKNCFIEEKIPIKFFIAFHVPFFSFEKKQLHDCFCKTPSDSERNSYQDRNKNYLSHNPAFFLPVVMISFSSSSMCFNLHSSEHTFASTSSIVPYHDHCTSQWDSFLQIEHLCIRFSCKI